MNSAANRPNATSTVQVIRKTSGAPSSTMRKYQQLALAIVSVISLMAFLFYKHEYDRLRYTLEYLELFGSSNDLGSNSYCGGLGKRRLTTVPAQWVKVDNDLLLYSSFYDKGNSFTSPVIRTIALAKKSDKLPDKLICKLWFELNEIKSMEAECSVEEIKAGSHVNFLLVNKSVKMIFIICKPLSDIKKVPYIAQFKTEHEDKWTPPILVQESEGWKVVENVTCACIFATQFPVSSLRLVEFIAHHSFLGVEKFVFFGSILTPLVRKLLDKYADEMNIYYEEKLFSLPMDYSLNSHELRILIEKDCIYRHRDSHENVVSLQINEFLVPRSRKSLQEVLSTVGSPNTAAISEFQFVSQEVCLDEIHQRKSEFLFDSQILSLSISKESTVSIIRPHLAASGIAFKSLSRTYAQHVPSAVANIYSFEVCEKAENHVENDHLPTNQWVVESIRKSLLYRKWKVN